MEILGLILVLAVLWGYFSSKNRGEKVTFGQLGSSVDEQKELESQMVRHITELIGEGIKSPVADIRLTKGEELLARSNVEVFKYQRTGRGMISGFTYRIPTGIKGLNYRIGKGRATQQKDWMSDGLGTVYLTNKALIIKDGKKSARFTWGSISEINVGLDYFHIIPNRGAAVRCLCEFTPNLKLLSLLHLENKYQNILSEIDNGKMTQHMKRHLESIGVLHYNG